MDKKQQDAAFSKFTGTVLYSLLTYSEKEKKMTSNPIFVRTVMV